MQLLVVEDDPSIADALCAGLVREGFTVQHVATGAAALAAEPGDLVLLDLGLPDLDGRVVCRELRAASAVPIIVVTARGDEIDRVSLLEIGADDYVVKPFGFRELVARIGAVLRRTTVGADTSADAGKIDTIDLGWLQIDARRRRVEVDGSEVSLTPKEYDLIAYLASDAGAILHREEIIRRVWDENWWGSTKTLDVHVASLRKKIGADRIRTVRGVGFGLADDGDDGRRADGSP
ncbi:MAG: response regulator transcription factor [Ilumatobacter sp.]|uniref:response regulator transcription factor n=1 Tax=Ilumatobacter sp. TaxID=1967498 RepID=UPI0032979F5D